MHPTLIFEDREYPPSWFERETQRKAAGLRRRGLQEGDTLAVMMRNCPEYVVLVLACRLAGVYVVSVNWHFKADEAAHLLVDSGAKLLVVHSDLIAQVEAGIPSRVQVVEVSVESRKTPNGAAVAGAREGGPGRSTVLWEVLGDDAEPLDDAPIRLRGAVPYTSGTTGKPKGVRRLPMTAERSARAERELRAVYTEVFGVTAGSVALLSAPIYHSAPMSFMLHTCLSGATLVLQAGFDPEKTLQTIERRRVTSAYLVPTMFQRLLKLGADVRSRYDLSSLEHVIATGSPCAPDLKAGMIEWLGPVVNEAYASSETGYVTLISSQDWLGHPGSVGRPLGGTRLRIVGEEGQDLPTGAVGQIYAWNPAQPDFTYVNNEAARRAMERDGLVCVGDMGRLDADGFLYISDRKADMVISGGANIYPAEIEAVLLGLEGVVDCAVFGIPDPEFGEALAAVVQPVEGSSLSVDDVKNHVRRHLANFKVPRVVEFQGQLPREDSGKIFKRLLKAPYWRDQGRTI